jgi:hypothetical protein
MQRWKKEIAIPDFPEKLFDEMVPKLFMERNVYTVNDIMDMAGDSNWRKLLLRCGVDIESLREKLDILFAFSDTRLVPVDYEISDSKLSHDADLKALLERVDETFAWYNPGPRTYVAPYFPMIQSSGMGKTKLLHELREVLNKQDDTSCELCLSGKIETLYGMKDSKKGIYSVELDLHKLVDGESSENEEVMRIAAESVMR